MKINVFLCAIALFFCSKCTKEQANQAPLQVRLHNSTAFDLENVKFIEHGLDPLDFGQIKAGAYSDFIAIDSLHFMGNLPLQNVHGQVDADKFQAGIFGYCPVGETFYTFIEGEYTYNISEYPAGYIHWDTTYRAFDFTLE